MNILSKLLARILRRDRLDELIHDPDISTIAWRDGIVIQSADGPVPEKWRRQAIINMRLDPAKFKEVERIILRECKGDGVLAKATMRRRYPEACPEGY